MNAKKIIEWLVSQASDKGVMASLRKGLIEGMESRAWPYITKVCNITNDREELTVRTIAALFALHPRHCERMPNLGASLKKLAQSRGDMDLTIHEKYLRRLTNCETTHEVCEHLRFIINMMKAEDIPVNYEYLCNDLYWWGIGNTPDRPRKEWCKGYLA